MLITPLKRGDAFRLASSPKSDTEHPSRIQAPTLSLWKAEVLPLQSSWFLKMIVDLG
jgi:hypothetical protein